MEDDNEQILNFTYKKGVQSVFPAHPFVSNWLFTVEELSEAQLAHHIAKVAEKNGLSNNDMMHIFPLVLRMLRSDIRWSNPKDK